MAKLSPSDKNLLKFLGSLEFVPDVPEVEILDANIGAAGITVDYSKTNQAIEKKFKKAFADYMKDNFNSLYAIAGTPPPGVTTGKTRVILKQTGGGGIKQGVIPTAIQEEGSTIIFNQVLIANKNFKDEESILSDKDTRDLLEKCFKQKGNWVSRLEDWTWTYWQQQKELFQEYQNPNWSPFVYGGESFLTFFTNLIKEVKNNGVKVGTYTTWNPSDVWAAYKMGDVKKEIDEAMEEGKTLAELNSTLIRLFKEKRLVGISLKKVLYGQNANIKLVNIDTATMRLGEVDAYGMPQIKLQIGNIFEENETVTTYIKFGSDNDFAININNPDKKKGSNLTFNTHIKKTPAAQGGQAPVAEVEKLLKGNGSSATYVNDWHKFPLMVQQNDKKGFWDESNEWEKKYNAVSSFYKGPTPTYAKWKEFISSLYMNDKTFVATAKLMHLSFFYDAINNFGRKPEFWTDLLYAGMKMGKRYAPHAKIS
jgi:hypothetical protein